MVANDTWVTPTPMLYRLYKAFRVLCVQKKVRCNSWCNTIFQKVFNAEYYTFAVLGILNI